MPKPRRLKSVTTILLVAALASVVFISAALSRSNANHDTKSILSKNDPSKAQGQSTAQKEFEKIKQQFPKVDYDSPEPVEPAERAKRRNKGKNFDNGFISKKPTHQSSSLSNHWDLGLPALPLAQSDVVLIANTLSRKAFLSNDKSGVYTETSIRIEEVIKGETSSVAKDNQIDIYRTGGVVRYATGEESLFQIVGQNMPLAGKRYLFFLKAIPDSTDYKIITGYELSDFGVKALDTPSQFSEFNGLDESSFLFKVRNTIAQQRP